MRFRTEFSNKELSYEKLSKNYQRVTLHYYSPKVTNFNYQIANLSNPGSLTVTTGDVLQCIISLTNEIPNSVLPPTNADLSVSPSGSVDAGTISVEVNGAPVSCTFTTGAVDEIVFDFNSDLLYATVLPNRILAEATSTGNGIQTSSLAKTEDLYAGIVGILSFLTLAGGTSVFLIRRILSRIG